MSKTTKRAVGCWRAAVIGLEVLCLSAAFTQRDTEAAADQVRLRDMSAANAVRRALVGATRRIGEPSCREVLADFNDLQGRPLVAVLESAGLSAEAQLARIFFYDGSELPLCKSQKVLGGTTPGSHVVYICAARFARSRDAENVILHEMLHTLGLGENPPGPLEIRARIAARCGL